MVSIFNRKVIALLTKVLKELACYLPSVLELLVQ
jgi:hypothetical protein